MLNVILIMSEVAGAVGLIVGAVFAMDKIYGNCLLNSVSGLGTFLLLLGVAINLTAK